MSTSAQNAAVAAPSQGQNKDSGDKVVPFENQSQVNLNTKPLTKEAYDLYYAVINRYINPKTSDEHTECRRHFLKANEVVEIALALGRQIKPEELDLLVRLDGNVTKCAFSTRGEFQPVRWIIITHRVLGAIRRHRKLDEDVLWEAGAVQVGQYFSNPDPDSLELFPVSGTPYYWDKNNAWIFANYSILHKAYLKNTDRSGRNCYGDSFRVASEILEERKRRQATLTADREGITKMAEVLGQAKPFRRPGGASGFKNQTGPDRRQKFVPSTSQEKAE